MSKQPNPPPPEGAVKPPPPPAPPPRTEYGLPEVTTFAPMPPVKPPKPEPTVLDVENLDRLITIWRERKGDAANPDDLIIAACYVDAFQTVRVNNGLGLLPEVAKGLKVG